MAEILGKLGVVAVTAALLGWSASSAAAEDGAGSPPAGSDRPKVEKPADCDGDECETERVEGPEPRKPPTTRPEDERRPPNRSRKECRPSRSY